MADYDVLAGLDDEVGALMPMRFRRGKRRGRSSGVPRGLVPQIPGVPEVGRRRQPLGFPLYTFNVSSGLVLTQTIRPQKPFLGRRLVTATGRTGASATGVVTITRFDIGVNNQLVQSNPIPADLFLASAQDVDLVLDPAYVGQDILLQLTISAAPTTTDTVVVSIALLGETMG